MGFGVGAAIQRSLHPTRRTNIQDTEGFGVQEAQLHTHAPGKLTAELAGRVVLCPQSNEKAKYPDSS